MNKELIIKYFNNNCSEEELELVLDWLTVSANSPEGKVLLHKIWEELDEQEPDEKSDYDTILCKIHHEINIRQSKILIDKSKNDLARYNRRQYIITLIRNVAAILFLPILGAGLFFSINYFSSRSVDIIDGSAYNEVLSSVDAITRVTLPDGSIVWLNHRSTLHYPSVFKGNSRQVELKGEGYFEVAHKEKIPFVVKVGDINVVAHGTIFNVMAYPEENKIETSLVSGNVELQKLLSGGRTVTLYKMTPGDLSVYDRISKELTTREVNDDRYFSWKDGKLTFTNEPLEEVAKKLGRWFNVDIKIEDSRLYDLTITATFVDETLKQVMELLALISPVEYSISGREKTDANTYTKRTVKLTYRK